MTNEISIVIGSWGSYNKCNERALGSKWLNLSDYSDWEEIEEELVKQDFELNGIDEELFIQDIEGMPSTSCNWDYTHPKQLFELLKESEVLEDDNKYEVMCAYLDIRTFNDFEELVNSHGRNWDDEIRMYKGYDWSDYGKMMFEESYYNIPEVLENFIDFEGYGRYIGDYYAEEYEEGIIEIYA
jgi:hypothetical protein